MYNIDDLNSIVESEAKFIRRAGRNWRHNFLSEHNSVALRVDGDFRDRIKVAFINREIVAKSGVLSDGTFSTQKALSPHIHNKYILHIDIRKYYEHLRFKYVEKELSRIFSSVEMTFIKRFYFGDSDTGLRRGLCASPFIAEILLAKIDRIAQRIIFDSHAAVKYTRFYDDLLFSGCSKNDLRAIEMKVRDELLAFGLHANDRKTKLLLVETSKILGLRVHRANIVVPKAIKKKARLRVYYVKCLFDKYSNAGFDDFDRIECALGTAIGTLHYIINNTDAPGLKWQKQLQVCYAMLKKVKLDREVSEQESNPVVVSDEELKRYIDMAVEQINHLRD